MATELLPPSLVARDGLATDAMARSSRSSSESRPRIGHHSGMNGHVIGSCARFFMGRVENYGALAGRGFGNGIGPSVAVDVGPFHCTGRNSDGSLSRLICATESVPFISRALLSAGLRAMPLLRDVTSFWLGPISAT